MLVPGGYKTMTTTDTQPIIFTTLVDHRLHGKKSRHKLDLLKPICQWLDDIEIKNSQVALS